MSDGITHAERERERVHATEKLSVCKLLLGYGLSAVEAWERDQEVE